MKKGILIVSLILMVMTVGGCGIIPGLGGDGDLTGQVQDAYFQPISGAQVTIEGLTATTDLNGAFTISAVPAGTKNLVVTKTGYAQKTVSLEIVKNKANTAKVILEESYADPARKIVGNFENSMYRLGAIATYEEGKMAQHYEEVFAPFVSEMTPYLTDVSYGVMHTEVFYNMPGTYDFIMDPYGYGYTYVQKFAGDLEAAQLEWIVNDQVNGLTVKITAPNTSTYYDDSDIYNEVIDLTGLTFDIEITSTDRPDAVYEASFVFGGDASKEFTITEGEYSMTLIVPYGPTAELTGLVDPNPTVADDDLNIGGTFDILDQTSSTSVVFTGSVETPVCSFNGDLSATVEEDTNNLTFNTPFSAKGSGTFTTGEFEIAGSFEVDVVVVEYTEEYVDYWDDTTYMVTYSEALPVQAKVNASYKSDATTFLGEFSYAMSNVDQFLTNPQVAQPVTFNINGSLTYVEGDNYTLDAQMVVDEEQATIGFDFDLARNDFTLAGAINFDEMNYLTTINIVDNANTTLTMSIPSETDKVGSITGADGKEYATIQMEIDPALGEGLSIKYTDGGYEFLPLNPVYYVLK